MIDANEDKKKINKNDLYDETWCLYDGQVIDDYIYSALSNFKSGARIISFSDRYHSGTVIKNLIPQDIFNINKSEINYQNI